MNCTTAAELQVSYLKNELEGHVKTAFEEHLAGCVSCRDKLIEARRILKWTESAREEKTHKRIEHVMREALKARASDIHFQPTDDGSLRVRYRIDGVLHDQEPIESTARDGVITRIKMMADMNVSQINVSQYGRIPAVQEDKRYDFRATSIPFTLGEGICMRIFDSQHLTVTVDRLGLSAENEARFREWITNPSGLVIAGGPTGSGKTTVVYTLLNEVNKEEVNVVTVEDPVEYTIPGISQIQVNRREGFTASEALRSLLMSDPDVIYVSDIADLETARAISDSALTGHLCIANMPGNDVYAMLDYLLKLGWHPTLLSSVLLGVSCQRLTRCLCKNCAKPVDTPPETLEKNMLSQFFGLTAEEIKSGKVMASVGCAECRNTGYRGRTAIYEVLAMNSELAQMMVDEGVTMGFHFLAEKHGFKSLREEAKAKVLAGITSLDEAFRVLSASF